MRLDSKRTAHVVESLLALALAVCCQQAVALPAPGSSVPPLFSQGRDETFQLKSLQGKPLEFDVLDDTPLERALGLAVISALNAQKDFEPKLDPNETLRIRVESLSLSPEGTDKLSLQAKVSGRFVDLPQSVNRSEFLAGKQIVVKFPPKDRSISPFSLEFTGGEFKLQLDPKKQELIVSDANAKVNFEAPIAGGGSESIRFSGRGTRQLK